LKQDKNLDNLEDEERGGDLLQRQKNFLDLHLVVMKKINIKLL
jgi:hypothetical protein